MKKMKGLIAVSLLMWAVGAQAHTHLKSSQPAEGSVITAPPPQVVLTFSEATRLTALTIQKEGSEAQKLTPPSSAATAEVSIPVPKLAPGKYSVSWRAVGKDNHVMSGVLHFTVAASSAATPNAHPHGS